MQTYDQTSGVQGKAPLGALILQEGCTLHVPSAYTGVDCSESNSSVHMIAHWTIGRVGCGRHQMRCPHVCSHVSSQDQGRAKYF